MMTSCVAAGQGNNPKAPPPSSQLLKAYIEQALHVQDYVDELYLDFDEPTLFRLYGALNSMRHIYSEMNAIEREIVDGSHIPSKLVEILFSQVDSIIEMNVTIGENEAKQASKVLPDILYTYQENQSTTCSFH